MTGVQASGLGSRHGIVLMVLAALACSEDSMGPEDLDDPDVLCPRPEMASRYPNHHDNPAWSSQGLIVYQDFGIDFVDSLSGFFLVNETLSGIWTVNPETHERVRIIPTAAGSSSRFSWSPDGTQLVLSGGNQLYTVKFDGSGLTQLTFNGKHRFPSWGPDGEWIAYDDAGDVWLVRPDGQESHKIGNVEASSPSTRPSWNPDGTQVVHVRPVEDVFPVSEVFVMNRDGTHVLRLTRNETFDTNPVFSPDGTHIAYSGQFVGNSANPLPQIWVMDADGTNARAITSKGGWNPSWSPDGCCIVYTRVNPTCLTPEHGVLWMVEVETGIERQLTTKWPER